jgi:hypothetical protein
MKLSEILFKEAAIPNQLTPSAGQKMTSTQTSTAPASMFKLAATTRQALIKGYLTKAALLGAMADDQSLYAQNGGTNWQNMLPPGGFNNMIMRDRMPGLTEEQSIIRPQEPHTLPYNPNAAPTSRWVHPVLRIDPSTWLKKTPHERDPGFDLPNTGSTHALDPGFDLRQPRTSPTVQPPALPTLELTPPASPPRSNTWDGEPGPQPASPPRGSDWYDERGPQPIPQTTPKPAVPAPDWEALFLKHTGTRFDKHSKMDQANMDRLMRNQGTWNRKEYRQNTGI